MEKQNDILELKIEKLSYGTDSIAYFSEDRLVVFVKGGVVGDFGKVKITSVNKNFLRGELIELIEPSIYRKKPICPIYNACGSCQLQNYDYDFLIEQKQIVLEDIFKKFNTKINPFKKSPEILEYRHKIQYPTRQTKNSKRLLIGYFKNNSHDITNIKFCPLQPNIINEITQYIRDNWKFDCYSEKTKKGLLKNILFRINSDNKNILLVFVINAIRCEFDTKKLKIFFDELQNNFKEVSGCFINFNNKDTNSILGKETIIVTGENYIIEKLNDKQYKIGPTIFFQVNPKGACELFDIVKENIKENSTILDAYGGVGAIGIYLKERVKHITLVEENKEATEFALENFKLNNIENYEILTGDAKEHFINFKKTNKIFDYIILDPPRMGCEKEALESILDITNNLIYVSCNPQTLKRDIEIILKHNFKLESIQGVDLFPYTYHIETVAILKK